MIEALERHPSVRLSLHYSGCLIDWLKQNHPEFLRRIVNLAGQGQVEIVGGAYYEPILSAIPDADKLGQIDRMKAVIKREFAVEPIGLWLAERVWEPYLAKIMAEADVDWTLIDDTAFKMVGLEDNDLFGYYVTEEQGRFVKVFPLSKYLRYVIPWHSVDSVISYLRQEALDGEDRIVVLGDDGEKFGMWPGTYDRCWRKAWVDKFFTELEANTSWLHTIPLGEYAHQVPPSGRIYLPCASYDEMLEWSLPSDKSWEYTKLKHQLEGEEKHNVVQFMHSGFWRNFLVKYPEINRMHKKMLRVHQKVYRARVLDTEDDCGLEELWKAQCNCPYWHGVFGGIYLADIRATTYRHLIQAEDKADKIIHRRRSWMEWKKVDFDGDGAEELLIDDDALSVYISPDEGGSIFECDIRKYSYNLFSTMARRPEAYHRALVRPSLRNHTVEGNAIPSIHDLMRIKDEDLPRSLVYDQYLRSSLIDHFLDSNTRLKEFANYSYRELGNFASQPYELSVTENDAEIRVLLRRQGVIQIRGESLPFEVEKEIILEQGKEKIGVNYQLKNISASSIQTIFGSEWNINLLGGGHNEQAYYQVPGLTLDDWHLDSWGELTDIGKLILGNQYLDIELELTATPEVGIWRFPVESISNSEGGVERLYQESCLLALLPLDLPPGGAAHLNLIWLVKPSTVRSA